MTQLKSRRRLHYGWIVVAVAGVAVLIGAGVRAAPGIFLIAMEEDIGISRSSVSLAVSLGLIFYGLAAPLSGKFVDRVGPRKVAALGLLITASGSALAAVSNSGWQLDLFLGVVSGIGTGLIGSVLGAAIANRWFVTNRSMVVGLFGALMSAGQLLFIPTIEQHQSLLRLANRHLGTGRPGRRRHPSGGVAGAGSPIEHGASSLRGNRAGATPDARPLDHEEGLAQP